MVAEIKKFVKGYSLLLEPAPIDGGWRVGIDIPDALVGEITDPFEVQLFSLSGSRNRLGRTWCRHGRAICLNTFAGECAGSALRSVQPAFYANSFPAAGKQFVGRHSKGHGSVFFLLYLDLSIVHYQLG